MRKKTWRHKIDIHIVKVAKDDIDTVYDIEREQFLNPWKKRQLAAELEQDLSFFFLARDRVSGDILGYVIFWIIEETMELHNIAAAPGARRKGVGTRLMEFMLQTARSKGVKEIFLEVRQSNEPAIALYKKYGFKPIDLRKNYFSNPRENALVFGLYL